MRGCFICVNTFSLPTTLAAEPAANAAMPAIGDSGNIIYVSKEENVSVGITGTFKPRIFDRVEFIEQTILAVI